MTASQTHSRPGASESGTWDHPWECGSRHSDGGPLLEAIPWSSYQPREGLRCSGIPAEMPTQVGCFCKPGTHGGPARPTPRERRAGAFGTRDSLCFLSNRSMRSCIPSLGRLPRDAQGQKHTAAQTHSWKRVLLVSGQNNMGTTCWEQHGNNMPERWRYAASVPLAGHVIHIFFSVLCLQASCGVRNHGSTKQALLGGEVHGKKASIFISASSSQPACITVLGSPSAPASWLWPEKNKIGKGASGSRGTIQ